MLPKFFFCICILVFFFIFSTHSYNTQCLHHQKTLLLELRNELEFNTTISTKLVQWNQTDECCKWFGVECDVVGYVISLKLDNESISGGIWDSSSLFSLKHLEKLNLAYNKFNSTSIPKGIGNLTYLTHLNLSHADFGGQVPAQTSSLKRLVSLDISSIYLNTLKLKHPNLEMVVQNLTGLRELYLDRVNITSSYERRKWSHIISSYLPNLTSLSLVECSLSGPLSSSFWKLHSLYNLRLDYTNLSAVAVPDLITNFPSLTTLSLANCSLKGSIPSTFANLTKLIHVDLSYNLFTGSLSSTLFEGLSNLVHLDLGENSFTGNIPESLFGLPSLLKLDLRYNKFNGTFQLDKFRSLANLTYLDLSYNSLSVDVGNVNSSSHGRLQLKGLGLASCNLSAFPDFIKHLDLEVLELSNNWIAREIPNWIWGTQLRHLDLSFNLLTEVQKPYHIPASLESLNLQSNQLRGELYLNLPIPLASKLQYLFFANNSFSGSIPTSLCSAAYLEVLGLSCNKLSGGIPPCLLDNIVWLDLRRNKINGSIPDNFSSDCRLQYFNVYENTLEGKIPKSLESCRSLEFMNLGNNNISDSFPCMLSSSLRVLILHSNRFHGEVRCHNSWAYLQVLDISSNHFSESLESINFSSWRAMVHQSDEQLKHDTSGYYSMQLLSSVTLTMKGLNLEVHGFWPDFGILDFSSNNFVGEIPKAIGDLTSLYHLNLSHNALNGSIPKSLGQLRNLESLDLSRNQLTGLIPMELAGLTFLSFLSLSYNKLVGEIPKGRQFQTFTADGFEGNAGLCGFPLNRSCSHTDDDSDISPPDHEDVVEEKSEIEWEYVSTALGYVVGLGSIVWLLLFCRSFRYKYFDKIDEIVEEVLDGRNRRRRRARMVARNRVRRQ